MTILLLILPPLNDTDVATPDDCCWSFQRFGPFERRQVALFRTPNSELAGAGAFMPHGDEKSCDERSGRNPPARGEYKLTRGTSGARESTGDFPIKSAHLSQRKSRVVQSAIQSKSNRKR